MPVWVTQIKKLPFGAVLAGNMFQRKIDEIFQDIPNVFRIADDKLVAVYEADGKDHDDTHHTISTPSPLYKTAMHPTATCKTNQASQLSSTNAETDLPQQYLHHLPHSLHSVIQKIQMTQPQKSA